MSINNVNLERIATSLSVNQNQNFFFWNEFYNNVAKPYFSGQDQNENPSVCAWSVGYPLEHCTILKDPKISYTLLQKTEAAFVRSIDNSTYILVPVHPYNRSDEAWGFEHTNRAIDESTPLMERHYLFPSSSRTVHVNLFGVPVGIKVGTDQVRPSEPKQPHKACGLHQEILRGHLISTFIHRMDSFCQRPPMVFYEFYAVLFEDRNRGFGIRDLSPILKNRHMPAFSIYPWIEKHFISPAATESEIERVLATHYCKPIGTALADFLLYYGWLCLYNIFYHKIRINK